MTLALNEDLPVLDLFWTMLLLFGWALFFYLLVVVFRDLFGRADVSAWGKAGWVALVLVLPVVGALIYLASQSRAMGERELARRGATDLRMDAYTRSVSGDGSYRGVRDVTDDRRAMSGPIRPA
jgi:hypothetical protein